MYFPDAERLVLIILQLNRRSQFKVYHILWQVGPFQLHCKLVGNDAPGSSLPSLKGQACCPICLCWGEAKEPSAFVPPWPTDDPGGLCRQRRIRPSEWRLFSLLILSLESELSRRSPYRGQTHARQGISKISVSFSPCIVLEPVEALQSFLAIKPSSVMKTPITKCNEDCLKSPKAKFRYF